MALAAKQPKEAGTLTGATTKDIAEGWTALVLKNSVNSTANVTIGYWNGTNYTAKVFTLEPGDRRDLDFIDFRGFVTQLRITVALNATAYYEYWT